MRIGRLFGIDVAIDVSWLFIFAIVAWSLGSPIGPFQTIQVTPVTRALLAVATALLLFSSVLIHEFAHSLAAKRSGIAIKEIRLFLFGGVSQFESEPAAPGIAAWISFAGPLTSFVLAGISALLAAVLGGAKTPAGIAFDYLAAANALLGAFNMLPAFPMDGGRVLQAIVWGVTHDRLRATRLAAGVGAVIAWILIVVGIVDVLQRGFGGGIWYMLLGWFLLRAGQAEANSASLTDAIVGHTALQLAEPVRATVPADALAETVLRVMLKSGARAVPVLLGERFIGIVTMADLAHLDSAALAGTYATALMKRVDDLKLIPPDADADLALRLLGETGFNQLPVVDRDGTFFGFVTRQGIIDWLASDRKPRAHAVVSL
jgi:Zn-dependent protease/CBS domain-containing protein